MFRETSQKWRFTPIKLNQLGCVVADIAIGERSCHDLEHAALVEAVWDSGHKLTTICCVKRYLGPWTMARWHCDRVSLLLHHGLGHRSSSITSWLHHPWLHHPWLHHPWLHHPWLHHSWLARHHFRLRRGHFHSLCAVVLLLLLWLPVAHSADTDGDTDQDKCSTNES